MGPWPSPDTHASRAVGADLSHLGFVRGYGVAGPFGAEFGLYEEVASNAYYLADQLVVLLSVLKYDDEDIASRAFDLYAMWAEDWCGSWIYGNESSIGLMRCDFLGGQISMYWNERWIAQILAFEGSYRTPSDLAVLVRDALSNHWTQIR